MNKKGYHEINKPSGLYHTANMTQGTAYRALRRLKNVRFIDYQIDARNTICYKVLTMPEMDGNGQKLYHSLCSSKLSKTQANLLPDIEKWVRIHRICSIIKPQQFPLSTNPLVFKKDDQIIFTFGLVTLEDVFRSVFKNGLQVLKTTRKEDPINQLKGSSIATLQDTVQKHQYKYNNVNKRYVNLLDCYYRVAFEAANLGLPFDEANAKQYMLSLKHRIDSLKKAMKAFKESGNEEDYEKSQRELQSCKNQEEQLASYFEVLDSGWIWSFWNIRGTATNRTQTSNPNLQGMNKKLRVFLKNDGYFAVAYDIAEFEIYIACMEANEIYDKSRKAYEKIAIQTGLPSKAVKLVLHMMSKGAGNRRISKEINEDPDNRLTISEAKIKSVINSYYSMYPKVKVRNLAISSGAETIGLSGRIPYYNLNVINIINYKASTAGVAHVDQTIGSSIVKSWAVNYSKTKIGKKYPIILDWHDNLTVRIPHGTKSEMIDSIKEALDKSLNEATNQMSYATHPNIKVEDLTNSII
ncbi:MAG: hypothetical protein ACP5EQ_06490 [Candidatus Cloacimonadia bacterium]